MDTTTVLAIIEMIEVKIKDLGDWLHNHTSKEEMDWEQANKAGEVSSLTELRDHLQEYIEQQVTYAENNLGSSE
jgi:hypothetical protein